MPRDSNGDYTAPSNSWNPPVVGSVIDPDDWMDQLADYEAAFTDSLSRSGDGGMQANLQVNDNSILFQEISSPGAPTTDYALLYALDSDGTKLAYKDSAATEIVLSQPVGQNFIHNGGMMINQRAVSSTATADDAYCLDRWYVLTQTASVQASQQTNQENGTPFNLRLTQNQAGAQRFGFAQIIESSDSLWARGQVVTLSGRIRPSGSQAIRYAVLEWTGTADSVTSDVVNDWTSSTYTAGNFFLGSNLTVSQVGTITPAAATFATFSLNATISASCNNLILFVWTEGTAAQNFTLDGSKIKLEKGAVATLFQDWEYPVEFEKCQRFFYYASGNNKFIAAGYCSSGTAAFVLIQPPTSFRIVPALTVSNVSHFTVFPQSQVTTVIAVSSFSTINGVGLDLTVAAGLANKEAAALALTNASATFALSADM